VDKCLTQGTTNCLQWIASGKETLRFLNDFLALVSFKHHKFARQQSFLLLIGEKLESTP
jgi:hypothetical protein